MKIGSSIFVLVLGAILAFAVKDAIPNVDLELIGYILIAAGLVGFLISLFMAFAKGKRVSTTKTGVDANGNQITKQESNAIEDDIWQTQSSINLNKIINII